MGQVLPLTGTGISHSTPPVLTTIPIAVIPIIDAGTASLSLFQRNPKNVHDHAGIEFTFSWNPRSRCAGNRDHDRPSRAAEHDGRNAKLLVMRSRSSFSLKKVGKTGILLRII
jgi:hypothetical protein